MLGWYRLLLLLCITLYLSSGVSAIVVKGDRRGWVSLFSTWTSALNLLVILSVVALCNHGHPQNEDQSELPLYLLIESEFRISNYKYLASPQKCGVGLIRCT